MTNIVLPKIISKRKKRVGRGYGSGKGGHTVGRGQKGQKARGKIGVMFEGIKVKKSIIKKLPFRRGKDRFKPGKKPVIVKLSALNLLPQDTKVDIALLIKSGIVDSQDAQKFGVKILGDGNNIEKSLFIEVPISKSAARKIEEAGGKIIKDNS